MSKNNNNNVILCIIFFSSYDHYTRHVKLSTHRNFYKTLCWNNICVFLNKNIAFDLGAVLLKQLLF